MASQIIVVGGGLGGMCAAHTVLQAGGRVVVLDKSAFCGGNSTKATSGINGAGSRTQRLQGSPDSVEVFEADTTKSAAEGCRPELVRALTHNSGPSIDWLMDNFGLELDTISRMAAHTNPRTHRGAAGGQFPGMMITYGLMEKLDEISAADPNTARVVNKATVTKLIYEGGKVVGCEYEKGGELHTEMGPVVLATGGFGADFTDNSLLASVEEEWRGLTAWKEIPQSLIPPLRSLPTTNGPHCTGDGIKMALSVGAGTRDLHCVQVHPTGIIDPRDPDAKVRWLAAEALRGHGGILIDAEGNRFANELGKRDYVSGRMWKNNKFPYRLLLNSAASAEIAWHCEHYRGRGLMTSYTGAELAKEMGISVEKLRTTFNAYSQAAETNRKTGQADQWGKIYFSNTPVQVEDTFNVAQVAPIVHYCMGGISANEFGQVLSKDESVIPGLFAAGEVIGGIHGTNRLGGSSLLDCVVYGRLSGTSAAQYQLSNLVRNGTVGAAGGNGALNITIEQNGTKTQVSVNPDTQQMSLNVGLGNATGTTPTISAAAAAATTTPAVVEEPTTAKTDKVITMSEVQAHKTPEDCWVVVDNGVYDVTDFLDDHPGGKKAITIYAGKDATEQFMMMHKPEVIVKYGAEYKVGTLSPSAKL